MIGTPEKRQSWLSLSRRRGDAKFDIVLLVIMAFLTILFFYPMYLVAISAFSSATEVYNGSVLLLPKGSNAAGFKNVFATSELWMGYRNSGLYTVVGTAINLFFTLSGAFVLSRNNFALRKPITLMIVFTMFFGGGMIPGYLLVKNLRLLNTLWALSLPGAISTWNLMVTRTFFLTTIPDELQDAAQIDGCNNIQFFIRVAIPVSTTILVVIGMFYAVGHWNSYWSALLYITKKDMYPLQLVLRNLLLNAEYAMKQLKEGATDIDVTEVRALYEMAESMKYIIVLASVLPIVILFPFVEKYFVKGIMIGSLKG